MKMKLVCIHTSLESYVLNYTTICPKSFDPSYIVDYYIIGSRPLGQAVYLHLGQTIGFQARPVH